MSFFDEADLDKQAAADKEASESPKFDPAPGDSINAILTKAEMFTGGQYDPTIVINLRNVGDKAVGGVDAGKIGYLFLPTVLRRKFLEAAPAVGTAFKLRFEGLVSPEGGGNSYKDWTLVTESMSETSKQDRRMWDAINPASVGVATPPAPQQSNTGEGWRF
jgi:hypothetical protein